MPKIDWDQFEEVKPYKQKSSVNWDEFEVVRDAPKITQGESLARGMAQGGTLGFADEISGGLEAAWKSVNGDPTAFGKLYETYRDQSRANFEKAEKENPKSYLAGEIGTGIATAFIPGVAAAKGAKLAQVAARAAGIGGAAGAGYSKEDSAAGIAKDTLIGGTLGALTAGAAPILGKAAGKIGDGSRGLAKKFAARAVGTERGTINKLARTPKGQKQALSELGDYVLDNNLLSPLASTDDMIMRNEAVKKAAMDSRKAAYKSIDDAGKSTFNPLEVSTKVEEKVLGGRNRAHSDTKDLIKKLDPELENILSRGDGNISMTEAQQLVENLGKKAKFDTSRSNESNDLAKTVYHTVRDAINEAAEKGGDSIDLGKIVRQSNKDFSTGKTVDKLLKNKFARELGNNVVGLTDYALAGGSLPGAIATGGASVPATAAAIGFKKTLDRFGSQNAALALKNTSKLLSKAPDIGEKVSRNSVLVDQLAPKALAEKAYPVLKSVADTEDKPTKGPKKWMNEGFSKLKVHDKNGDIPQKTFDELMQTTKGQELLIQASDLKPGSKAMDSLMKKIRTGYIDKKEDQ